MMVHRPDSPRVSFARFVNDENGCLVGWNKAAEGLLGYREADVLGRSCHEVVCGRDIFGNRFCLPGCSHSGAARLDRPLHDFVMHMRTAAGKTLRAWLRVRSRRATESRRALIVHTIKAIEN